MTCRRRDTTGGTRQMCILPGIRSRYPIPRDPSTSNLINTLLPVALRGNPKIDHLRGLLALLRTQKDKKNPPHVRFFFAITTIIRYEVTIARNPLYLRSKVLATALPRYRRLISTNTTKLPDNKHYRLTTQVDSAN